MTAETAEPSGDGEQVSLRGALGPTLLDQVYGYTTHQYLKVEARRGGAYPPDVVVHDRDEIENLCKSRDVRLGRSISSCERFDGCRRGNHQVLHGRVSAKKLEEGEEVVRVFGVDDVTPHALLSRVFPAMNTRQRIETYAFGKMKEGRTQSQGHRGHTS